MTSSISQKERKILMSSAGNGIVVFNDFEFNIPLLSEIKLNIEYDEPSP